MVEKVIAALRRAGKVVLVNPWLLGFELAYSAFAPLLFLGGTGVPLLLWLALGNRFDPFLLWRDPLGFIAGYWQLILLCLAGFFVGFAIYLLLVVFFQVAVTGTVARAVNPEAPEGAAKIPVADFWVAGSRFFGAGMAQAAVVSLVPLLPALGLCAVLFRLALQLPSLIAAGRLEALLGMKYTLAGLVLSGGLTMVTCWLAFIWFGYSLAALCVDHAGARSGLGRALDFITGNLGLVLLMVLASLLLGMASWSLTAPVTLAGKLMGFGKLFSGLAQLVLGPLSFLIGVAVSIWMRAAVVVLYADNRNSAG